MVVGAGIMGAGVGQLCAQNGYEVAHILNLGDETGVGQDEIIDRMIVGQPTSHVLVVGFVNIHTHQAEMMLDYFENVAEQDKRRRKRHLVAVA